jgi:hypothetical protein
LGIDRKERVDISLNGVHVAHVVPNSSKPQRIKLPKKYLKAGVENEVVFDQIENPPKAVPWAIAKAKLVIRPLPMCSGEECVREAKKAYDLADEFLSKKDLAVENRFKAWRSLHIALLYLEAVEPEPDLSRLVKSTLRDLDTDLEKQCEQVMSPGKPANLEELGDYPWAPCGQRLLDRSKQLPPERDGGVARDAGG